MGDASAVVESPIRRKRVGRGFSLNELKEAGLTTDVAKKLGLYVDKRRRSIWPQNVRALKKLLEEKRDKLSEP
jgi:large subunit ribosomal protein L13e